MSRTASAAVFQHQRRRASRPSPMAGQSLTASVPSSRSNWADPTGDIQLGTSNWADAPIHMHKNGRADRAPPLLAGSVSNQLSAIGFQRSQSTKFTDLKAELTSSNSKSFGCRVQIVCILRTHFSNLLSQERIYLFGSSTDIFSSIQGRF